jgi:predicted amidohydrolase YtcJ
MMLGARSFRELGSARDSPTLRLGPVKVLVREGATEPSEVAAVVAAARRAGHAVALHAVTEAELVVALAALRGARPAGISGPDRIEHAALVPDDLVADIRAARVTVVGNPGFLRERGDVYAREHPKDQHAWLYRVASLRRAGIAYAAGSDAPVGAPVPAHLFDSLVGRLTESGAVLGPSEALRPVAALTALTAFPARAGGWRDLGVLRPGAFADIAVVDRGFLTPSRASYQARLTIAGGRLVWRRPSAAKADESELEKGAC